MPLPLPKGHRSAHGTPCLRRTAPCLSPRTHHPNGPRLGLFLPGTKRSPLHRHPQTKRQRPDPPSTTEPVLHHPTQTPGSPGRRSSHGRPTITQMRRQPYRNATFLRVRRVCVLLSKIKGETRCRDDHKRKHPLNRRKPSRRPEVPNRTLAKPLCGPAPGLRQGPRSVEPHDPRRANPAPDARLRTLRPDPPPKRAAPGIERQRRDHKVPLVDPTKKNGGPPRRKDEGPRPPRPGTSSLCLPG